MKESLELLEDVVAVLRDVSKDVTKAIRETKKQGTPFGDDYLTRDELAAYLNVSFPTISAYEKKGILTARKVGRRRYYSRQQVEDKIKEGTFSR